MSSENSAVYLTPLIQTDMNSPLDPETVKQVLSSPPFLSLPSIINIRDLGLLPNSPIPPGLLYRSGALNRAQESNITSLKNDYNLKAVLDLRVEHEISRSPNPVVNGVKGLHFSETRAPSPINLDDFIDEGGRKGYVSMYEEILEIHRPNFKGALEWVRDRGLKKEEGALLFHCTAGKDRTGVLASILLSLADASRELIAYDYALTRVGIEPARELLLQMLKLWNKDWTPDTPGMNEYVQVKEDFMIGALDMLEQKYAGAEGYAKSLGLVEEDLKVIKTVLRGE